MNITIKNQIQLDGETELIKQVYPVQVTEKNDQIYLVYQNEENEKVIIKCGVEELVMTRYSTPKSIMRFHKDNPALVAIPTPIGMQYLMTETDLYHFDIENNRVRINYQLKQIETEAVFADYQLEIQW